MRVLMSWLLVVSLSLTVLVFSVADNTILHVTEFEEIQRLGIGSVYDLAFHPDNQTLAVATATGLYLYSVPDLVQTSNFDFFDEPVTDLIWSPDGKWLAFATDNEVSVWNRSTDEVHFLTDGIYSTQLDWSPDGRQLGALGMPLNAPSNYNNPAWSQLHRWQIQDNRIKDYGSVTVQASQYGFTSFHWAEDYMIAQTSAAELHIMAWPVSNPQQIISLRWVAGGETLTASPDKRFLVLNYYYDQNGTAMQLLDTRTLTWRDIPKDNDMIYARSTWKNETLIVVSDNEYRQDVSTQMTVFDTATWQILESLQLSYPIDVWYGKLTMALNGQYIATVTNSQLMLIDISSWEVISQISTTWPKYHTALAISPDNNYLAVIQWTPDQNEILRIIDIHTEEIIVDIPNIPEEIGILTFSPNSDYLAILHTENRHITFVNIDKKQAVPYYSTFPENISKLVWRESNIFGLTYNEIYQLPFRLAGQDFLIFQIKRLTSVDILKNETLYEKLLHWNLHDIRILDGARSDNGTYLAIQNNFNTSSSSVLHIQNTRTNEIVKTISFYGQIIDAVAWHHDYLVIATSYDYIDSLSYLHFYLIDTENNSFQDEPNFIIEAHNIAHIGGGAVSSEVTHLWWEGDELYSIGVDGTVRTWGIPD